MRMRRLQLFLSAIFLTLCLALPGFAAPAKTSRGLLFANIATSKGVIVVKLYEHEAPITVANFTGLATGKKAFRDPKSGKMVKRPFFNGILFHRVIPKFMIQAGDPLSRDPLRAGTGGPGYTLPDEIYPGLHFDRPGRLAMANRGAPHTAGSQFFITVAPAPHLNGSYTIFGQVVRGQNVADAISRVPRNKNNRPLQPVAIRKITVYRAKSPR